MAERARKHGAGGEFVVAVDETRAPLAVEGFNKLSHTEDFTAFSLPSRPRDHVLWWNADYVLYAARAALPDFDYYVMIEYDVFVNVDIAPLAEQWASRGVDLIVHDLQRISPNHKRFWSSDAHPEVWWGFIPFMAISGRAVDALLRTRQSLAVLSRNDESVEWPYCETFIPTALLQAGDMVPAQLGDFADTELFRFLPNMNILDPALDRPESLSHPVLGGPHLIRKFISHLNAQQIVLPDGRLCPELQREDRAELSDILSARVARNPQTGQLEITRAEKPSPRGGGVLIDLAHRKPALQSSHSQWSLGATAADDAAGAVCGIIVGGYAFHTVPELDPWWRVDLLDDSIVEEIEIALSLVQPGRFSRFRIETSRDGVAWITRFVKSDDGPVPTNPARLFVLVLPEPVIVRYVRIVQSCIESLHLSRVRVFGCPVASGHAAASSGGYLATLLADHENRDLFATTVESIVHGRVFGRGIDSYNLDALAFLAAGIDSSNYLTASMAEARRFRDNLDLLEFAADAAAQSGLVLEFGVYSGKTINLLAERLPGRRIHGFDQFDGSPETWRPGFERGTSLRTELPEVRENVTLIVGWFDRTLPDFMAGHPDEPVALLHIDCDLGSSAETVLAQVAERLVAGTIIVFDKYFNYPGWRAHEFRAFQEFVGARGIKYEYLGLVPRNRQVAVKIVCVG
jgi:hypothetical protein